MRKKIRSKNSLVLHKRIHNPIISQAKSIFVMQSNTIVDNNNTTTRSIDKTNNISENYSVQVTPFAGIKCSNIHNDC